MSPEQRRVQFGGSKERRTQDHIKVPSVGDVSEAPGWLGLCCRALVQWRPDLTLSFGPGAALPANPNGPHDLVERRTCKERRPSEAASLGLLVDCLEETGVE